MGHRDSEGPSPNIPIGEPVEESSTTRIDEREDPPARRLKSPAETNKKRGEAEAEVSDEPVERKQPSPPTPKGSALLRDLHLKEARFRHTAKGLTRRIRGSREQIPLVELDWVRVEGKHLRVTQIGADTILILLGDAGESGVEGRLAVGIDGKIYSVETKKIFSPRTAAEALEARLRNTFETQLEDVDGGTSLRLIRAWRAPRLY